MFLPLGSTKVTKLKFLKAETNLEKMDPKQIKIKSNLKQNKIKRDIKIKIKKEPGIQHFFPAHKHQEFC